jgi:Fe2+ transport system protein B
MKRAKIVSFVAFDTLKYAEKLEKSGFSREQSAVQAEAQAEILTNMLEEKLATKDDLKHEIGLAKTELRQEMVEMKTELRQEMAEIKAELKQDIHDLRVELKQEINDLRVELKQEINDLRVDMHNLKVEVFSLINSQTRWLMSTIIGAIGVLGLLMGLFKFIH